MQRITALGGLVMVALMFACLASTVVRQNANSAPASARTSDGQWRVVVSYATVEERGRPKTVFIATVFNASKQEQVLFTPGVVGPIFWPAGPREGVQLEPHVAPRQPRDSSKDYVTLSPEQGFSRIFECLGTIEQLTSVGRVDAYLHLYQPGFEGHSDRIVGIVTAPAIRLHTEEKETQQPQ